MIYMIKKFILSIFLLFVLVSVSYAGPSISGIVGNSGGDYQPVSTILTNASNGKQDLFSVWQTSMPTPVVGITYCFDPTLSGTDPASKVVPTTYATTGVVFDNTAHTITRSTGTDFVTAGYLAGHRIRTDFAGNLGPYTIQTVSATVITVATTDVLTSGTTSAGVTIRGGLRYLMTYGSDNQYHYERNELDQWGIGAWMLPQGTATAPITEGSIYHDTSTNLNTIGDGAVAQAVQMKTDSHVWSFSIIDPAGTVGATPVLIPLKTALPEAITITGINVTCDADPTTELTGDLKWADAFIGLGNAAVINDFDTAAGVRVDTSITSGSVASGKCLYLLFDATPDAALKSCVWDVTWHR